MNVWGTDIGETLHKMFKENRKFSELKQDTGAKLTTVFDGENKMLRHTYTRDVQPLLDLTSRERNSGYNDTGDWRRVAVIPQEIWFQWQKEYGEDFHHNSEILAKLLNSDYYKLKTTDKRL